MTDRVDAPDPQGSPPDGYEFDIFLSFPKKGTAFEWVKNHFYSDLKDALTDELGLPPTIFRFTEQQSGVDWRENLVRSLLRSRCMVAIWAPTYFRSQWCEAELKAMLDRQRQLRRNRVRQVSLVYPVIYRDGESFPAYARAMFHDDMDDMSNWAIPGEIFRHSPDWPPYFRAVRHVAVRLKSLLPHAPPWQPDWPFERPTDEEPDEPPSVLPRM